jgi:hypothetical protein
MSKKKRLHQLGEHGNSRMASEDSRLKKYCIYSRIEG